MDLVTEFYEDYYIDNPMEALKLGGKDGEIVLDAEDDPLLAKWERELADGLEPDLTEGMAQADRDQVKRTLTSVKKRPETLGNPRYDSKHVVLGSKEEALLRGKLLGVEAEDKEISTLANEEDWLSGLIRDGRRS